MPPVIEIKNLKKHYRYGIRGMAVQAVDGISMSVDEGEVFGMLGPNGAGKSTTIKIILGLLRQSSGECLIFGDKLSRKSRRLIGYLPESPYFYKFLSGFELVKFYARLCGMGEKEAKTAAMKALDLVGLGDAANRQIGLYSKGMVQRAGIAQAVVHNPKLVILDEPASGLDPIGAADMVDIIARLKREGKTVLLCSHMMSEVEKLCTRAAILNRGKIAAIGRLDEMLRLKDATDVEFETDDAEKLAQISDFAAARGVATLKTERAKISLDEFFRKTVEKSK